MTGPAPATDALVARLGMADLRIDREAGLRNRYLLRNGAIHRFALHPLHFFTSNVLSPLGRLRLLIEPFVPPLDHDESVADFVRRRLGREWLEYVFDPLVGGLHAGDPERLSMSALLPRLKGLERRFGSLTRGILKARQTSKEIPGSRHLFSFQEGLATLPQALALALKGRLRMGVMVDGVRPGPSGGYLVMGQKGGETTRWWTPNVVVALPSYAAARVLESFASGPVQALETIPHPPLAVVFLGYRSEDVGHPLDGFGYLAPGIEHRPALGMLFSSTLFPGRAPEGHVALTAFVGGVRQPDLACLTATELEAAIVREASVLLNIKAAPVLVRTRFWPRGLPQYEMGHGARVEAVRRVETDHPGLFVTGNYLAGVSTSTCIEQAHSTAQRVLLGMRSVMSRSECQRIAQFG